jgi:hypothetical protein
LKGAQTEIVDAAKNKFFTLCTMFENVPFFEHMRSKGAKSANMTKKLLTNCILRYQKAHNFMLIPNSEKIKWKRCKIRKTQNLFSCTPVTIMPCLNPSEIPKSIK